MGCDGGTIPRRDELVKTKKKPEARDKDSDLSFQWRHCSLTQQLLQAPIVTCGLGKLYNKLSLIEALLSKSSSLKELTHIKNLKDLKELNLTPNTIYENDEKKGKDLHIGPAPFICPVIGLEMTGKFRFVALWSCGCVFSERALKQIDSNSCLKCQKPFKNDDVIILNGNEEDLVLMKERIAARQLAQKKKKESKKKVQDSVQEVLPNNDKEKPKTETPAVVPIAPIAGSSGIGKRSGKLQESKIDMKKMKADYSVAKDPKVTDVYKSLFTTHQSEKDQNRAHWVTYNPFYN